MNSPKIIRGAAAVPRGGRFRAVREALDARLARQEWAPGERLPTEAALAREYGVSISTVRRAIDGMVERGLLLRRQGSGTYAMQHDRALMMDRYFHVVRKDGRKAFPTHDLLSFRVCSPPPLARKALRMRPGPAAIRAESLVRLQGRPALLDIIWLPAGRFPALTRETFERRRPTSFALYQRAFGITVCRADESVVAARASAAVADLLEVAPGQPLLEIRRTAYDAQGHPVEFRQRLLSTARHVYSAMPSTKVRLGKLR
jgi:GntR family transcriptional regulator